MSQIYEKLIIQRKKEEESAFKQLLKSTMITELLSVNKLSFVFNSCFPGEISEDSIEVVNRSDIELTYKVHIVCEDEEFDKLEEYVFSMRKSGGYEYNDRYVILQNPGIRSLYKVAVKVPNMRQSRVFKGKLSIFSDDLRGKITIPITCKVFSVLPRSHFRIFAAIEC